MTQRLFAILCLATLATGCASAAANFAVLSSRAIPYEELRDVRRAAGRVEASQSKWSILGMQLGRPDWDVVLEEAMSQADGCFALADVEAEASSWSAFLFGAMTFELAGTPLIDEGRR